MPSEENRKPTTANLEQREVKGCGGVWMGMDGVSLGVSMCIWVCEPPMQCNAMPCNAQ